MNNSNNITQDHHINSSMLQLITIALMLLSTTYSNAQTIFKAGELQLGINGQGSVTDIYNTVAGKNLLAKDTAAPLPQAQGSSPVCTCY